MNRTDALNWNAQPQPLDRGMLDNPVERHDAHHLDVEHSAPVDAGDIDEEWFEFVANEHKSACISVGWANTRRPK